MHLLSLHQEVVKFPGLFCLNYESDYQSISNVFTSSVTKRRVKRREHELMFSPCFGADPYIHNKSPLDMYTRQ